MRLSLGLLLAASVFTNEASGGSREVDATTFAKLRSNYLTDAQHILLRAHYIVEKIEEISKNSEKNGVRPEDREYYKRHLQSLESTIEGKAAFRVIHRAAEKASTESRMSIEKMIEDYTAFFANLRK
ncbi:hypothetical protein PMAYCL1PPCAC_09555 [Pristionchus mayeri]|uniref:Uncharacterized protein n=1 Tax=Pristionchus mayeri TaxID=1317129 RepID=A0AAN4ZLU6_9BILA|nr:hypothetical protein PMAYCL1PPCAC_09555 [Pristionchus mayeri]